MNPSRLFIVRPIATTLLMVAILLFGLVSYRSLPVAALPEVDYPTIQVVTLYPGANPDVMNASVTAPLERQFGQMSGLKQMSSQSAAGASVITLQFDLALNLDIAEQEVQAAINIANTSLPSDLPTPPIYNKVNPADPPILTLAITADHMLMTDVQDIVDTRIAQRVSQVSGVGLVTLAGGQRPAVRVDINPEALASYGLSTAQVRTVISSANVNTAKGGFDGATRASTISANDQLHSPDEYAKLILAYKDGAPIRLGDVAHIYDGPENQLLQAWSNLDQAIILNVQKQPGANVIATVDQIKSILPQLQANLPADIKVELLTDRTFTIRESVKDVQFELMLAISLVVMVVFLFLRNVRATLIPTVAVPLSLIGTFAVMQMAGFSINNLSLMALTIATGFVVDDAIVVVENISRYLEQGDDPLTAALKGSKEIAFTIISLTISLVAVLIPLLFMGDIIGRLFREFAVTLAVAILISGVISLTLTPMMSAQLLRPDHAHTHGRLYQLSESLFNRIIAAYGRSLSYILRIQKTTLMVAVSTLLLTVLLFMWIPKGFFPQQDNGVILGITQAPQYTSFKGMAQRQQTLIESLLRDPDVASISSFIGVDGQNPSMSTGRLQINLIPLSQRERRAPEIIKRLQELAAQVPELALYLQPVQDLTIETSVSRTQYQFILQANNRETLNQWLPQLVERLQQEPMFKDVGDDSLNQGLIAFVDVNRDVAASLGVSVLDIGNALYDAFGQRLVSTIYTQASQYRVVLGQMGSQDQGLEALSRVHLVNSAGNVIPLSSVARFEERTGPLLTMQLDQFPAATVYFNLSESVSLGDAVTRIQAIERELGLPDEVSTHFQGAVLAFQSNIGHEIWLILAAIVAMYIVLGVLYESYIHPITILSTLPSAGIGAFLSLMIAGQDLSVIAIVGVILLIGIVKKNAIMMIDFALVAEREQGLSPQDAIYQACLLRFRPILMTTMAALLGALPLMLSVGIGAELRRPLGIAMVGGLIFSQVLTLYTTPVIYLFFDRLAQRVRLWTMRRNAS